jgi:hypothetical protein
MYNRARLSFAVALAAFTLTATTARASHVRIALAEMAQTAHLVFVGTVESQTSRTNDAGTMIVTDVVFTDVEVVSATDSSRQRNSSRITLTFPGGTVGDLSVSLSSSVRVETGRRYLLFAYDDGKIYASPTLGGSQGLFEIVRDAQSSEEFVLAAGRRAVVGFEGAEPVTTDYRVLAVEGGKLVADAGAADATGEAPEVAPVAADGTPAIASGMRRTGAPAVPVSLRAFIEQIRNVALKAPLEKRVIRSGDGGRLLKRVDGRVVAEPLKHRARGAQTSPAARTHRTPLVPLATPDLVPTLEGPAEGAASLRGGALGACGRQRIPIVMEQYPADWVEFGIANDCMWTWNQSRSIFRYIPDDGTFALNDVSEFGGYPSSEEIARVWGIEFDWGTDQAVALTRQRNPEECGEILESDVFLNPAYDWATDFNDFLADPEVAVIRPTLMHELGHVWGQLNGRLPEPYDYDVPTVMHRDWAGVLEDGWGVHAADAWLIRAHYGIADNGGPVDVGVESYFASGGLNASTISGTRFAPGARITLGKVTVENMSRVDARDVRIRFFLSSNNVITTSDAQMGGYWFWNTFRPERYNVSDYTMSIPNDIPNGTYYVGAIVTVNGFDRDSYRWNNATFFPKKISISR